MLKFVITIDSFTLFRPVRVLVALPHSLVSFMPYKAIWALHPSLKGADMFFDDLCITSLVEKERFAFIAPDLGNGFFVNTAHERQADFLQTELIPLVRDNLCISSTREDNMLLGISAGGYGALRWAFDDTGMFSKVAAISSLINCVGSEEGHFSKKERFLRHLFLEDFQRITQDPHNSVEQLLYGLKDPEAIPQVGLFCGTEDHWCVNANQNFYRMLQHKGVLSLFWKNAGEHDREFWLKALPEAVRWLLKEGGDSA